MSVLDGVPPGLFTPPQINARRVVPLAEVIREYDAPGVPPAQRRTVWALATETFTGLRDDFTATAKAIRGAQPAVVRAATAGDGQADRFARELEALDGDEVFHRVVQSLQGLAGRAPLPVGADPEALRVESLIRECRDAAVLLLGTTRVALEEYRGVKFARAGGGEAGAYQGVVRVGLVPYLRAMWNLFWKAFRHPTKTTEIDLLTGRVVGHV